jgi:Mlc titration factor MtfA (ptsG expression regulator)
VLARVQAAWRRWREDRACRRHAIPDALWQLTLVRYPFLSWRPAEQLIRLRRLATLFLTQKEFSGAHGLVVTDEMAVAVAAQAGRPARTCPRGAWRVEPVFKQPLRRR